MNRCIYILLFAIGITGFYSVAFAGDCNLTVKCVCESNSFRIVPCPAEFSNDLIDCTKEGIPEGTCAVDCGQQVIAASCGEIGIECRNNETPNCLVTLPVEGGISGADCALGETNCSGSCVDTNTDASNCGACDNPCVPGEVCVAGSCESSCVPGETACSGTCVDTDTDNANCGSCGNACAFTQTCVAGACTASSCVSDADCITGQYCDQSNQCVNKKSNGQSCSQQNECASGNCVDGFCCDTACDSACNSCNFGGSLGTCTINAAGIQGSPSCSPYLCNGASANCPTSCTSDADCVIDHYCDGTQCVPLPLQ